MPALVGGSFAGRLEPPVRELVYRAPQRLVALRRVTRAARQQRPAPRTWSGDRYSIGATQRPERYCQPGVAAPRRLMAQALGRARDSRHDALSQQVELRDAPVQSVEDEVPDARLDECPVVRDGGIGRPLREDGVLSPRVLGGKRATGGLCRAKVGRVRVARDLAQGDLLPTTGEQKGDAGRLDRAMLERGASGVEVLAMQRDFFSLPDSTDDLESLAERRLALTWWGKRQAELGELALDVADPDSERDAALADLVDVRDDARGQRGMPVVDAVGADGRLTARWSEPIAPIRAG